MKKILCIMVTLIFAICSFVIFVSASASTAEKIEVGTNLRNCTITISATEASTAQADLTRVFVLDSGDKIYFSDHLGIGATTYHYYGDGIFGDGNISWVCSFTDLVYTFPDDKDYIVTTLNSTYISGTYVSNTPKTTFDLSTLGLAAGEHIITVKAKADGYLTSAASASLAYTVEENVSITLNFTELGVSLTDSYQYSINNGASWVSLKGYAEGDCIVLDSNQIKFKSDGTVNYFRVLNGDTELFFNNYGDSESENFVFDSPVDLSIITNGHSGGSA